MVGVMKPHSLARICRMRETCDTIVSLLHVLSRLPAVHRGRIVRTLPGGSVHVIIQGICLSPSRLG